MAVSLINFLYGTNEVLAEKVYNLVKGWRVGVNSCHSECDLVILSMYLKVLTTDLTNYNITATEVRTIINNITNIFNINNITIEEGDIIEYITYNTNYVVYNNPTIAEVPSYFTTYSGVDEFIKTVIHGLGKYNPTVVVTDITAGVRSRIEVGIVEIDTNTIELHFSSSSQGEIKVM